MASFLLLSLYILCSIGNTASKRPNIVFIMGESVASSGYFFGKEAPMPIPNLQWLMKNGVSFPQTYAAAPVCNPSRATTITGRHAHKHGHYQLNPNTGLWVNGAWNNHEGKDPRENNTFFNFTKKYGDYQYEYFGKLDWNAGGHSESCRVTAWGNKVNFPYTLNDSYNHGRGWFDESGAKYSDLKCNVSGPNCTQKLIDWDSVQETANWILNVTQNNPDQPFFAYWGSNIVHPPYGSTAYWLNTVNTSMVDAPKWINKSTMHPEDFQSAMKKGMFIDEYNTDEYKQTIRAHYYALIAEYDMMIGVIIDALKAANVLDNTWIIATADHGDMKMEHRQYYKMVFYDSSSRVPSIIYGGDNFNIHRNVIRNDVISSLLDYFPTIMDMAQINLNETTEDMDLDGYSLMPYVWNDVDDVRNTVKDRPNYVMSQFHGDEIHLSWFLLRENEYKYVTYGSGKEVQPRLFNLERDPEEMNDLAQNRTYWVILQSMDKTLRSIVDYPAVAEDVESYNKQSFMLWRDSFSNQTEYNETVSKGIRWKTSWAYDSEGCFEAIDTWLKTPNDTFAWAFA